MKSFITLAIATLLTACANLAPAPDPAANTVLLHDSFFAPASKPVRAADVFAVSDEMRLYLREQMGEEMDAKGKERALYDALYSRNQLFGYDAEKTRTPRKPSRPARALPVARDHDRRVREGLGLPCASGVVEV